MGLHGEWSLSNKLNPQTKTSGKVRVFTRLPGFVPWETWIKGFIMVIPEGDSHNYSKTESQVASHCQKQATVTLLAGVTLRTEKEHPPYLTPACLGFTQRVLNKGGALLLAVLP